MGDCLRVAGWQVHTNRLAVDCRPSVYAGGGAVMEDYCVEFAWTLKDLVKQVNTMIGVGYKPIGGITVIEQSPRNAHYQSMIKEETRRDEPEDTTAGIDKG